MNEIKNLPTGRRYSTISTVYKDPRASRAHRNELASMRYLLFSSLRAFGGHVFRSVVASMGLALSIRTEKALLCMIYAVAERDSMHMV